MTDGAAGPTRRQCVTMRRSPSRRESGQAAVETAIVMPLFVFMMMGLIQLGLAHQARLMTRYAAYKATRAGAIHRAKKDVMTNAALAVLVPLLPGPDGKIRPPKDEGSYATAWQQVKNNQYQNGPKMVITTICNPTTNGSGATGRLSPNDDFDDPQVASGRDGDWVGFKRTRLHAQITFNYELLIPFANGILFWATVGVKPDNQETFNTLRLRNRTSSDQASSSATTAQTLISHAKQGRYFLPIRANWAMRLQSNVAQGELPTSNDCKVNFNQGS